MVISLQWRWFCNNRSPSRGTKFTLYRSNAVKYLETIQRHIQNLFITVGNIKQLQRVRWHIRFGHSARVMISSIPLCYVYPLAMRHATAHKFECVNRTYMFEYYTTFLLHQTNPYGVGGLFPVRITQLIPMKVSMCAALYEQYWIKTRWKKTTEISTIVFILHLCWLLQKT